jgi:hypothetical protein
LGEPLPWPSAIFGYNQSAATEFVVMRIHRISEDREAHNLGQCMISAGARPDRSKAAMRCMAGAEWLKKRL